MAPNMSPSTPCMCSCCASVVLADPAQPQAEPLGHIQVLVLQAVMQQLLSMGAINGLPDDIQWAIRMLLPRGEDMKAASASSSQAAAKPAEAALSQLVPSTAYLPYMLQPQQLAVLTQHAQQVRGLTGTYVSLSLRKCSKLKSCNSLQLNQLVGRTCSCTIYCSQQ